VNSVQALQDLPVTGSNTGSNAAGNNPPQLVSNLATITHGLDPAVIDHYTLQRVIDVNASVAGRDLGSSTTAVEEAIRQLGTLPRGTTIAVRGQSQAMTESFHTLELGIILAAILVYLLMVANFQSWMEPLIIMLAVPGSLAGALWMLAITHTTINVESLMGMIMAVGVGVANANLLIIFANDQREEGAGAVDAAIEAGRIRFRPIIMTALAMVLGMLPMAIGIGSGSELNAPLGRAVIGGLLAATLMTLFVVPAVYSMLTRALITKKERDAAVQAALDASEA
jgi:multidrug efflux pump subunit AcrB